MKNNKINKLDILKSFIYDGITTKVKENDDNIFVYTKENPEPWWNFVFFKRNLEQKDFKKVQNFFCKKERKSSIYLFDDLKNKENESILKKECYKLITKDSYLFWDNKKPKINDSEIIEVKTDNEFNIWIKTFVKSYPKDDPKNPYGEQKQFAKLLKKRWNENKVKNSKYFIVFKNKIPVSVGMLTSHNKQGYLSLIGSIPSVRGQGYGKKVTLYCINESFKLGNKNHYLITEKGHYPFKFYNKIGFNEKFSAYLYNKS
jgi:ribosomal protein S18 acetylase RimI-like enzyme